MIFWAGGGWTETTLTARRVEGGGVVVANIAGGTRKFGPLYPVRIVQKIGWIYFVVVVVVVDAIFCTAVRRHHLAGPGPEH